MQLDRGYLLSLVATGLSSLSQLGLIVVTHRLSSEMDFGRFSFALGVYGLVFLATDLGLSNAYAVRMAGDGGCRVAYWRGVSGIRFRLAMCFGLGLLVLLAITRDAALPYASIVVAQNAINALSADWVLIGMGRLVRYGVLTAVQGGCGVAFWCVLYICGVRGPFLCLASGLVASLCWVGASLALSNVLSTRQPLPSGGVVKVTLKRNWPMSLMMISLVVIQSVDVIALRWTNGFIAAGAYFLWQRGYSLVVTSSYSVLKPLLGLLAKRTSGLVCGGEDAVEAIAIRAMKTFVPLVVLCVCLVLPAYPAVSVRSGIILLLTAPLAVTNIVAIHFVYVRRTWFRGMVWPLSSVIVTHCVMAVMLSSFYGIVGAAIANTAGQVVCSLSILRFHSRLGGRRAEQRGEDSSPRVAGWAVSQE